eukprot:GSA120T00012790001.1
MREDTLQAYNAACAVGQDKVALKVNELLAKIREKVSELEINEEKEKAEGAPAAVVPNGGAAATTSSGAAVESKDVGQTAPSTTAVVENNDKDKPTAMEVDSENNTAPAAIKEAGSTSNRLWKETPRGGADTADRKCCETIIESDVSLALANLNVLEESRTAGRKRPRSDDKSDATSFTTASGEKISVNSRVDEAWKHVDVYYWNVLGDKVLTGIKERNLTPEAFAEALLSTCVAGQRASMRVKAALAQQELNESCDKKPE